MLNNAILAVAAATNLKQEYTDLILYNTDKKTFSLAWYQLTPFFFLVPLRTKKMPRSLGK